MSDGIRPTDDIIPISILHQAQKLRVICALFALLSNLQHDRATSFLCAVYQGLLDYVAGKFVRRICEQPLLDQCEDSLSVCFASVCDHMLHDIVAILVNEVYLSLLRKLFNDAGPDLWFAELNHALYDPASVRMGCKATALATEVINDELDMLRRYALNSLLYDMVAVGIFDTPDDIALQFRNERCLLVNQDLFQSFLYDAASIHLHGKLKDVAFEAIRQLPFLVLIAMLKELLDHVVPKNVRHKLQHIWLKLLECTLLFIAVCSLEFSLQEPRAALVPSKLNDMPEDFLHLQFTFVNLVVL